MSNQNKQSSEAAGMSATGAAVALSGEGDFMQIKTILMATDFSDESAAALNTAIDFAREFGARLILLHAYHVEIPPAYGGLGGDFKTPQDILERIQQAAEAAMDQLVSGVSAEGVDIERLVVMERSARAILDEAERLPADLIVMGTRGLTGLGHLALGSTAERVVRLADCPVLTVKAKS